MILNNTKRYPICIYKSLNPLEFEVSHLWTAPPVVGFQTKFVYSQSIQLIEPDDGFSGLYAKGI